MEEVKINLPQRPSEIQKSSLHLCASAVKRELGGINAMKKAIYDQLTTELSILYEISSLSFQDTEEKVTKEAMEKATRIFPVHYFALLAGQKDKQQVLTSLGFRNPKDISIRMGQKKSNQFQFAFGDQKGQTILFMEQTDPIGDRERRLYTIFARRLGNALLTTRSIIAHRCMEEALRESKERFQQIIENAQEWIWEVDANGLYTYASPIVEGMLGYKPEELVGKKHFYDLFEPEDQEELKKETFETFTQKQPFREFTTRNIHKNGKIVWLSTSGVPMLDEKGNLLGYRGADIDITERKQMQEKLIEAEKLAAASLIASEAAHEIKNPLAVIKTGLYYLKRILPEGAEEAQKNIRMLDNAVERATIYINDLLNFSKPPVLNLMPVEINELLEKSLKELPQEILAGIEINKDFETNLPQIMADPERLKQVFVNIIKNAAEAMEGKGKLRIANCRLQIEGKEFIQITFEDTGRGIPKKDVQYIFDPFFTTKGKGTGLGLAICQRIIEAHKGEIEVISKIGEGATFIIKMRV